MHVRRWRGDSSADADTEALVHSLADLVRPILRMERYSWDRLTRLYDPRRFRRMNERGWGTVEFVFREHDQRVTKVLHRVFPDARDRFTVDPPRLFVSFPGAVQEPHYDDDRTPRYHSVTVCLTDAPADSGTYFTGEVADEASPDGTRRDDGIEPGHYNNRAKECNVWSGRAVHYGDSRTCRRPRLFVLVPIRQGPIHDPGSLETHTTYPPRAKPCSP